MINSVMLAAKFFDDQYFNNAYYAKVGGVPCNEMNLLEVLTWHAHLIIGIVLTLLLVSPV
jgi:hypothetical protein